MAPAKAEEISNSFALDLENLDFDRNGVSDGSVTLHDIVERAGRQADIALRLDAVDNDRLALRGSNNPRPKSKNYNRRSESIKYLSQEVKAAKSFSQEVKAVKHFSQELVKQEFKRITKTASSVGTKVLSFRSAPLKVSSAVSTSALSHKRGTLLTRQKSGAENALQGLKFISKTTEDANADFKVIWNGVEERFQKLASSDGLLSRANFGLCIGMKDSKEFALELFDALARRRGLRVQSISKEQLHAFCLEISDQRFDSRLKIFFDMCDKNADGRISEEEVKEIIMLSASANQLSRIQERAEEYAALIMEELDPDEKGYIELWHLQTLLLQGSAYGKERCINYSQTLSQNFGVPRSNPAQRLMQNTKYLLDETWQQAWVMFLWFAVMSVLFMWKFRQYRNSGAFKSLGYCLCVAKGSAETLKFNLALILLPVCRNVITWLRSTFLGSIVPFDDNINFHKTIAGAISVGALVHTASHVACNYPRVEHCDGNIYDLYLRDDFGRKKPDYKGMALSVESLTGILMDIMMAIAFVLATSWFRRSLVTLPWPFHRLTGFNAFWYTHHSFVVLYLLLIIHGFNPLFDSHWWHSHWWLKTTWMYLAVPLLLYGGERTLRAFRAGYYTVNINKAAIYPGNVLALHMSKPPGFKYKSGMYLFLQCPNISPFEWHPFTITSAPDDENISVHIRTAGDWTLEMKKVFSERMKPPPPGQSGLLRADRVYGTDATSWFPKLRIDGPYGAPAQSYHKYDVLLLIGLGIGATPFISILKDILNNIKFVKQQAQSGLPGHELQQQDDSASNKRRKGRGPMHAHFYWVTREQDSFDWFKGVMNEIAEMDHMAAIEMHNYLTSVYEEGDARSALITMLQALSHAKNGVDILSGTRVKTHFARPKWQKVFSDVAAANKNSKIGVFYCGPLILAKQLKAIAKDFNHGSSSTKFEFHKENF